MRSLLNDQTAPFPEPDWNHNCPNDRRHESHTWYVFFWAGMETYFCKGVE